MTTLVRLGFVASLVLLAACGGPTPESQDDPTAALLPGDHVWTAADGVALPYTVAGDGDVTIVLVHCWMCDRTFWREQIPVLAERYRVVAMDLPGHGEAGVDRETWTVAAYGDDVAGLVTSLDLDDVVLVGHSMGGPVSLRAAALIPDRVRGIVAVDTLHDAEFDMSGEGADAFRRAFEADFAGTCERFVRAMLPEAGVDAIVEHVLARSCTADRAPVGVPLMFDFGTIDMPAWFEGAGVPIRAVNAAAPNPTKVEINRKYADFDAVLVDDVGHYLQMTRPDRVNPLLIEAIEELTR